MLTVCMHLIFVAVNFQINGIWAVYHTQCMYVHVHGVTHSSLSRPSLEVAEVRIEEGQSVFTL